MTFLSRAEGQYQGIAIYAAMSTRFPCQRSLDSLTGVEAPAIQVLLGTFGDSPTCINTFLANNPTKNHLLLAHLSNEVCRRNKRCFSGELLPRVNVRKYNQLLRSNNTQLYARIRARIEKFMSSLVLGPNSVVAISTGLEDNYDNAAFSKLYSFVKQVVPNIQIFRNPLGHRTIPGVLLEHHGRQINHKASSRGRRIYNLDSSDIKHYGGLSLPRAWASNRKGAYAILIWSARWQGYTKPFKAPKKRRFSFTPTDVTVVRESFN